jgi:hypothetical protein
MAVLAADAHEATSAGDAEAEPTPLSERARLRLKAWWPGVG